MQNNMIISRGRNYAMYKFQFATDTHYTEVYIKPLTGLDVTLDVAFSVDAGYIARREILLYCFVPSHGLRH
jgi:hypothetical protein